MLLIYLLISVLVLVTLVLIGSVLLQSGVSSGALGNPVSRMPESGVNNMEALTKFISVLAVLFFVLNLVIAVLLMTSR